MRFSAWLVENVTSAGPENRDLTFLKGHLPPPDKRPLAFMDCFMLVHSNVLEVDANTVAEYVNSIGLGEKFPKPARQWAIFGNILKNDNWLCSDVYGDPSAVLQVGGSVVLEYFPLLVAGGGLNAPHVDHIVPQMLGGPNCFSNAQITSHSCNVQKGNHTQSLGFRSEEWRKDMMQRWNTDPNFMDHTHALGEGERAERAALPQENRRRTVRTTKWPRVAGMVPGFSRPKAGEAEVECSSVVLG